MSAGRILFLALTLTACGAITGVIGAGARGDSAPAPAAPVAAPPPPATFAPVPAPEAGLLRKLPKLDSHLDLLYRIDVLSQAAGGGRIDAAAAPALPAGLSARVASDMLRLDDDGLVQVYADVTGAPHAAASALQALGMRIEIVSDEYSLVQGWLPVGSVESAAALPAVRYIRPASYGVVDTGSVNSAGDAILDADDMRATFGVTGAGVRVGVLSNGLEGWTDARDDGDLPATIEMTTCDMTAGVPTDPGAGSEGTAMLEIVHDLAPGAELWFGYWQTTLEFIQAVDCLADNVDVIIDDLSFFNLGSYDGTSDVSLNLTAEMNDVTNRVRAYHKSAGNRALSHYQEPYSDFNVFDDDDNTHRFQATAGTTDQLAIGPINLNPVFLVANGFVVIQLQWNDAFGASANDYDLFLVRDSDVTVVAQSIDEQSGTQDPVELIVYQNTGATGFFDIVINKFAGAPKTFDMFVTTCDCVPLPGGMPNEPTLNYNTVGSSISNNGDASGRVVTHGAINADDPGNDEIAPYSGRGPTNDGRLKPEAVAIDGVAVTGAGGFPMTFLGTSAAAPHGGAIAALILSCNTALKHGEPGDDPNADRDSLRNAMFNTAVDLGAAGDDNVYGNGRVDADAAAAAAGCTPLPPDTDGDGMPDAYENARACLNVAVDDGGLDPDLDGLTSFVEFFTWTTEPCVYDHDGDGCADGEEVEEGRTHQLGGQRDPLNEWDFYDVNDTGRIDAADIGLVRNRFTGGAPTPPEDAYLDRSAGVAGWAPNGPDGFINAVDIGHVRSSFNDRCDLAP